MLELSIAFLRYHKSLYDRTNAPSEMSVIVDDSVGRREAAREVRVVLAERRRPATAAADDVEARIVTVTGGR